MTSWNMYGLQDASSPIMEEFIYFHDFVMTILVFIMTVVGYMMLTVLQNYLMNKSLLEGQMLESVWTLFPALILIQIALPSLILLYTLDDCSSFSVTLKVLGHQWYWTYEYSDFWSNSFNSSLEFDAYMIPENELNNVLFRLLETDNRPALPFLIQTRVIISSTDVLHSWTVPSLGVKADANPGRLNQVKFMNYRPGLVYGQCSEICGANHSFMPISLEFINAQDFLTWVIQTSESE